MWKQNVPTDNLPSHNPPWSSCSTTSSTLGQCLTTEIDPNEDKHRVQSQQMEDVERTEQPEVVTEQRAKNLEILSKYIQRQCALLERIKLDITNFEELKSSAEKDPQGYTNRIVNDCNYGVDGGRVKSDECEVQSLGLKGLNELVEDVRGGGEEEESITDTIDWKLFEGHDSSSICELAVRTRYAHSSAMFLPWHCPPLPTPSASKHPPAPSRHPRLCGSEMMIHVRAARAKILDPVLERNAQFLASLPPDTDEEPAKGSEKPKGRTSNGKHKTHAHGGRRKKHVGSNTAIRPRGPGGVFIKRSAVVEGKTTPEFATPQTPASATLPQLSERSRRLSSVSSFGDAEVIRPKRQRRTSVTVLENVLPLGSRRSSRRQSTTLSTPVGSASPAPETPQQPHARLVIRLPPLSTIARSRGDAASNGRESATPFTSTSSSASTSLRTPSGSTGLTPDMQTFGHLMIPKAEHDDEMDVDEVKEEEVDHYDWNGRANGSFDEESADEDNKASRASRPAPAASTSQSNGVPMLTKNGKVRSETFNQAWSVSEQHLLDRLLEQYPDGTKNRWAKISKAMDGRRTARQVASRVQKYFAKMKKFGVDMNGK